MPAPSLAAAGATKEWCMDTNVMDVLFCLLQGFPQEGPSKRQLLGCSGLSSEEFDLALKSWEHLGILKMHCGRAMFSNARVRGF